MAAPENQCTPSARLKRTISAPVSHSAAGAQRTRGGAVTTTGIEELIAAIARVLDIHNTFNNRCAGRSRGDRCGILPCAVRCVGQGLHFASPLLTDHRVSSDRGYSSIGHTARMAHGREELHLCG